MILKLGCVLFALAFAQEAAILSASPVPEKDDQIGEPKGLETAPELPPLDLFDDAEPDALAPPNIQLPELSPSNILDSMRPFNPPVPEDITKIMGVLPEILKDLNLPMGPSPTEIEIEFPRGPTPRMLAGGLAPFNPFARNGLFQHHFPSFMSPIHPFMLHPPMGLQPHRSPFNMIPLHMPAFMGMPSNNQPELPIHMQHLISETAQSNPDEPMVLKMEKRHGFFVISGWFPGVAKEGLTIQLSGSNLNVMGRVSDKSEAVEKALGELGDIDEVNETMQLPYAPDAHLFKAHFDETTHKLTAVFPEPAQVAIELVN
eukprot:c32636_g1_i1.p1 GENE.c32636_g1_i1~~c32636_g1_i1.p1  ORF type:complete len:327 (+),score=60.31 c32636_g1_i1:35-982(+)